MSPNMGMDVLDRVDAALDELQSVELSELSATEQMRFARRLEMLRRRMDAGTDRATAQLDSTQAFWADGHRNVRNAVKHLGRLTGGEALGRVQTIRAMAVLADVAAAYADGKIPTAHMREIARVVANPRVDEHLAGADRLFAAKASTLGYDPFVAWLKGWVDVADPEGADRDDEINHQRRDAKLVENFDGSWTLTGQFGSLQGAALHERFDQFVRAELEADWAWARERFGPDATVDQLPRTTQQRRADAWVAMAIWAGTVPADGRTPQPLVNIVVDQQTFDDEVRRSCGEEVERDPNEVVDTRRCQTLDGTPLRPSDVMAAAMVGFVRRVVVDSAGNVIDLGRRRRLFTGSSREAAMIQAMLRQPGGLRCFWPGCDGRGWCLQADHRDPSAAGGPTDVANSDFHCGFHNRLKEHGFKPVQDADGTWTMHRPDGAPITPAV